MSLKATVKEFFSLQLAITTCFFPAVLESNAEGKSDPKAKGRGLQGKAKASAWAVAEKCLQREAKLRPGHTMWVEGMQPRQKPSQQSHSLLENLAGL